MPGLRKGISAVERSDPGTEFCVDIVVKGRKTEVPERFRKHVAEKLKLEKIQKLDGKVISLDVEVSKEPNPRQADRSDRVEITLRSRGPVIRAEAAASRPVRGARPGGRTSWRPGCARQHDKRHTRRGTAGSRPPRSPTTCRTRRRSTANGEPVARGRAGRRAAPRGSARWRCRAKARWWSARRPTPPRPMTLDQALYEMELVGHDFYLFVDSETKQPERRLPAARLRLRRHPPQARTRWSPRTPPAPAARSAADCAGDS